MRIHLEIDTSSTKDVADLAILSTALSGGAPVATPGKNAVKADPAKNSNTATNNSNDGGSRITIEMVREASGTKKSGDVKLIIKEMGFEGLSVVTADKLPELLEKVKALANK